MGTDQAASSRDLDPPWTAEQLVPRVVILLSCTSAITSGQRAASRAAKAPRRCILRANRSTKRAVARRTQQRKAQLPCHAGNTSAAPAEPTAARFDGDSTKHTGKTGLLGHTGTHFARCRVEPYEKFYQWVEYCREAGIFNCMVEHDLDRVFHALGDPTRRAILNRLADGEATVGHLSRPFPLSFAAVSKHLGVLERAGLVTREARGRERVCRINPGALTDARAWLEFHERFWTDRLDALEAFVGTTPDDGPDAKR